MVLARDRWGVWNGLLCGLISGERGKKLVNAEGSAAFEVEEREREAAGEGKDEGMVYVGLLANCSCVSVGCRTVMKLLAGVAGVRVCFVAGEERLL